MRKLNIDGKIWQFKVGKQYTVIISPENEKNIVLNGDLKELSQDEFNRGKYKKTSDGMIFPSDVSRWIRSL